MVRATAIAPLFAVTLITLCGCNRFESSEGKKLDKVLEAPKWTYGQVNDSMTNEKTQFACRNSNEVVIHLPPYSISRMELCITGASARPEFTLDSKGQGMFVCNTPCGVLVKADKAKPIQVDAELPEDGSFSNLRLYTARFTGDQDSSGVSIVNNYGLELLHSAELKLRVTMYGEGEKTVSFDMRDLHWPPRQSDMTETVSR